MHRGFLLYSVLLRKILWRIEPAGRGADASEKCNHCINFCIAEIEFFQHGRCGGQ